MAVEAEGASESSSSVTPLSDVFSSSSEPAEKSASAEEKPAATEGEGEGDQKFPVGDSSPEKQDEKQEKSEKPSQDAKDKSEKTADVKPGDEKKEEKPSQDEKALKEKWETDENPFKKRFQDTAANWNKEHQENLQLRGAVQQMQQEMTVLRKMADGTYDPEKDDPSKQITHEDVATKALHVGKVLASKNAAISQFGADEVNSRLGEFTQVFGQHELVNNLVLNAESPVHEAFRILDRYKFETKYGSTPADWHKSIRAEAEKELSDKLRKEITDELMGRVDKKNKTPRGLSSSRGSNGLGSGQNSQGSGHTPLKDLF
jgi:hypothetical protein